MTATIIWFNVAAYNPKLDQRKVLQNTERNSDPVHRKYESYWIDYEEKAHTIKKSKSNNLFEDIKPCTSSKGISYDLLISLLNIR